MRRGLIAFILMVITAWPVFGQQAKMPEIWVAGRVFNSAGAPLAGATVEVMNLMRAGAGRVIEEPEIITDASGKYSFQPLPGYEEGAVVFAMIVWDGTDSVALSPRIRMERKRNEKLEWVPVTPGNVQDWIDINVDLKLDKDLENATATIDLHCVELVDVTGTIRIEDGRLFRDASVYYEVRYEVEMSRTGGGGEVIRRDATVIHSPTSVSSLPFIIKNIHPTETAWWIIDVSGANSYCAEFEAPSASRTVDLVFSNDEFNDYIVAIVDEEGLPVEGAELSVWYWDYGAYYYGSYGEDYISGPDGRCIVPKGHREIYTVTLKSVPDGYEMPEQTEYEIGEGEGTETATDDPSKPFTIMVRRNAR